MIKESEGLLAWVVAVIRVFGLLLDVRAMELGRWLALCVYVCVWLGLFKGWEVKGWMWLCVGGVDVFGVQFVRVWIDGWFVEDGDGGSDV